MGFFIKNEPLIFFVGMRPPPFHGYSYMNDRCFNELSTRFLIYDGLALVKFGEGVGLAALKKAFSYFLCGFMLVFFRVICGKNVSVYISLNSRFGLVYDVLIILLSKLLLVNRVVLHHHNFSYINSPTFLSRILCFFSKTFLHVVLCKKMAVFLSASHRVPDEKIVVLSNSFFISDRMSCINDSVHDDCISVGFISNITREKGGFIFLDLVDRLAASGLNFKAILAGPIDKSIEMGFLDEINARQNIKYLGAVYGDEKSYFYSSIDFLVFPSIYENEAEPVVVLESLLMGKPVFSTDVGCLPSMVDGGGGMFFKAENFASSVANFICEKSHLIFDGNYFSPRLKFDENLEAANVAWGGIMRYLSGNN